MNFTGQTAKNQNTNSAAYKKWLLQEAERKRKEREKARKAAMEK